MEPDTPRAAAAGRASQRDRKVQHLCWVHPDRCVGLFWRQGGMQARPSLPIASQAVALKLWQTVSLNGWNPWKRASRPLQPAPPTPHQEPPPRQAPALPLIPTPKRPPGVTYTFTPDPSPLEGARRLSAAGARVHKFSLKTWSDEERRHVAPSLAEAARHPDLGYARIFDLPLARYVFWAYPVDNDNAYQEFYDLVSPAAGRCALAGVQDGSTTCGWVLPALGGRGAGARSWRELVGMRQSARGGAVRESSGARGCGVGGVGRTRSGSGGVGIGGVSGQAVRSTPA